MLDQYQNQLTRMLEAEQYGEAKELLRFLLQCQGEEKRHYDEWGNLLTWLEVAFPFDEAENSGEGSHELEDEEMEASFRREALVPEQYDETYVQQVLYIIQHHPVADQQILALERATHLKYPGVDETIVSWLTTNELHPALQFKALQCLRRRGLTGPLQLERLGELVELDIEQTPLAMDDFPQVVARVVERVELVTEVIDVTMPHFAKELWKDCLQCLYGTSAYDRMLKDDDETVDCFAAALHQVLELSLYGRVNDDDVRDTYGITDTLRFRYEQACRSLRQVALLRENGNGDES
ncbi:hypothetical protein Back11_05320 [Paenibacillus baekrokdamisoli]|uniref:Uncharacterized protein n=1 Tax=Paenibacillus baekrokdamisoli TaxID=1712516 RepID=A0A3G9IJK7_9BACL|nr:hypothetical protein [Paenibacillus baekrokdamisoli]MBB3067626.1 hypothetical protein [Paenibacillus baekrokdamisoli]BBH19187.1 hypothetical protein Back11_05320 [Paenibacillus baekrokdamisoli]